MNSYVDSRFCLHNSINLLRSSSSCLVKLLRTTMASVTAAEHGKRILSGLGLEPGCRCLPRRKTAEGRQRSICSSFKICRTTLLSLSALAIG
uniref:Uncharacterized protein n=1 Tax=Meloidogyne enterolobii TaxID=390850 RepID=A0A6V7VW51_MELEN|nr:unnamed protein product [Meloidogyne enterolobii]